ncbi:uncharacterized protein LOC108236763 [Kryptolebias marmoratus]|uniref:uncharacterized protein LOC108236763 n=1 Tax=Kryptolebias marmoratus TaxID=37003 RepID=UPI000D5305AE|nr:uncharacterized protein LOC108236763 [Kryptolebias marmoratus]
MWRKILLFLCYVACQVTSHEIKVTCNEVDDKDFPPVSITASPSEVAGLEVVQITKGEELKLNISWAINIDASIDYLTGTWFEISGEPSYLCKYNPSFAKANLSGSEQKWFHFQLSAREGFYEIEAFNVPLVQVGTIPYRTIKVTPPLKSRTTTMSPPIGSTEPNTQVASSVEAPPPPEQNTKAVIILLVKVLAALIILSSCCIIYKRCIPCSASYLTVRSSPVVPVSVLVVYPAENSVFQHAVVALAEFLQLHGSCRVAIDLWQQGKIAELGPLRWLAEQVKAADRILIVSPQGDTSSSLHSQSIPNHSLPEHSIPATAHDLYPLILNMVASHAKSASEMTKFWVMHLNKKPCVFLPELKACKSFCLMKDLNKFCKSLHSPGKVVKKISSLLLKPGVSYSKNSTTKLREAIGMLEGCKSSLSREILIGDL